MEGIRSVYEKKDCYIVVLKEVDSGLGSMFESIVVLITDDSALGHTFETASKSAFSSKMREAEIVEIPEELAKKIKNIQKIWERE
jgi:hypothetical protein